MKARGGLIVLSTVLVIGGSAIAQAREGVKVGERASDFTLVDIEGKTRALSEFDGKWIVLEWFNHECPFVRKHYGSGNMQQLQRTYTQQGVVWLSINSSGPGQQGYLTAAQASQITKEKGAAPTAVLLDPDGLVGRRYGAKTTPHMFVMTPDRVVAYEGAIDDTPSTNLADIAGATNYVQAALEEGLAGQPISVPSTESYGCSVKYRVAPEAASH